MPFSNARISNSRAETYAATSSSPVVDNAASDDCADRVRASSVLARLRDLAGCIFFFFFSFSFLGLACVARMVGVVCGLYEVLFCICGEEFELPDVV